MKFDAVLIHIGEFGASQLGYFILSGLINLVSAWQNLGITFFGVKMDHWCLIPELQHLPHELQKELAIPKDEEGEYSQCTQFALEYNNRTWADWAAWNRSQHVSANTTVLPCDAWVYDQSVFKSSIVSQFDLVCDREYLVSTVQTVYMAGFLAGCILFGQMSDSVGRRPTVIATMLLLVLSATGGVYIPNFAAYVVFRFLVGAGIGGSKTTVFVMGMEMVGPKHRQLTGVLFQTFFAVGVLVMPPLAYAVRDHFLLQLICGLSPVVLWATFFILPESPRWLVAEGQDEAAIVILERMARLNGTELPENLNLVENRIHMNKESEVKKGTLADLWRTPNIRRVTATMWAIWFVTSMGYYGISLGVSVLPGSIFQNSFIMGVVELVGYTSTAFILERAGRRWPALVALTVAGSSCLLAAAFVEKDGYGNALVASLMVGKCFAASTFSIIYVYSAEVFPTVVRNLGVGSSSMVARVGGFLQPQVGRLSVLWEPAPFLVYGIAMVLSGICTLMLPETLHQKLPETLEEGEEFASNIKLRCCPFPKPQEQTVDVSCTIGTEPKFIEANSCNTRM